MERIGVLINKLQELYEQQASPEQILHVTQMLQTELFLVKQQQNNVGERKKIAVLMPAMNVANADPAVEMPVKEPVPVQPELQSQPVVIEELGEKEMVSSADATEEPVVNRRQFNVLEEVPTLAHQPKVKELNDIMSTDALSLNDRLGKQNGEVGEKLKETPVKDIKKAISLNDRFIYIRELFRGDEAMYERSLKTINQFSIYPEAEFWIQRELKLKLGWHDEHPLVMQFDQLIKRRFL